MKFLIMIKRYIDDLFIASESVFVEIQVQRNNYLLQT